MPGLPGRRPVRHVRRYLSGVLRLFGGTLRDAATAAVSGMLLFGALRFCQRLRLNGILQVCWPARWQH